MNELGDRFVVRELAGYRIRQGGGHNYGGTGRPTPISCSVLDTADAFREVARFDSGRSLGRGSRSIVDTRAEAHYHAAKLNREIGWTLI